MRQLRKNPGFALTAVLSLALGIAATTSVFSVVYGLVMHPYPYRSADRMDVGIAVHIGSHPNWEARVAYFDRLRSRIAELPEVIPSRTPSMPLRPSTEPTKDLKLWERPRNAITTRV